MRVLPRVDGLDGNAEDLLDVELDIVHSQVPGEYGGPYRLRSIVIEMRAEPVYQR